MSPLPSAPRDHPATSAPVTRPRVLPEVPTEGNPTDRAVLRALQDEADAVVAFQGLRHQLELHPQVLVRALRRLQREGYIVHAGAGYRLTEKGHAQVLPPFPTLPEAPLLPIVRVLLPRFLPPETVAQQLAGRWFDGLRWHGRSHGPNELLLLWRTDPGGAPVRVRLVGGSLLMEVAPEIASGTKAAKAAQALFRALATLYGEVARSAA